MTSKNAAGLDLHIPQVAIDTLNICGVDAHLHDRDDACVKAISAPVVAAELRRIVEEIARSLTHLPTTTDADHYFYAGVRDTADGLTRRADELDPPAGTRED